MAPSFQVGQAPWEAPDAPRMFPVGQAPWETGSQTPNQGGGIEAAKAVGNFLFPIVGDVYHDIKGDGTKSVLQQVGDAGLSALPFIPGLGELGEGARAAKLGIEGAGAIRDASMVSRIAASPITRGALTGYGAGVASNLSQGEDLGQAFMPNTTNVVSTIFGAAAPAVMGKLSSTIKSMSGLTPDIENELAKNITPGEAQQYINTVKARGQNLRAPTAVDLATSRFDAAADQVSQLKEAAGQVIGETKLKVGQMPLKDVTPIITDFENQVRDRYGISIVPGENGLEVMKDPTRMKTIPTGVQSRILEIATQLNALKGESIANGSDVASNISAMVDYTTKDQYNRSLDPLEGLITHIDGSLRGLINETSPDMASANAKFSALANLESEIKAVAGSKLQRGSLLIRRATAGNSADAQALFDKIQAATGADLTKEAVLAKWATDVAGNPSEKTLFQSAVQGAQNPTWLGILKAMGEYAMNKTATPERAGMNAITGGGIINKVAPWATKGGIELQRSIMDLMGTNN